MKSSFKRGMLVLVMLISLNSSGHNETLPAQACITGPCAKSCGACGMLFQYQRYCDDCQACYVSVCSFRKCNCSYSDAYNDSCGGGGSCSGTTGCLDRPDCVSDPEN